MFSSDVITFDQLWHHLFPKSKKGKVLSNKTQIRVIDLMEPVIFTKILRNLSENLVAKFPANAVSYSRVKIARLEDARLDLQPFWEHGCSSSFPLRLDHWSEALVRDVTSASHVNYYAVRHGTAAR